MLTQERLKELLDYDPETGVFVRKIDRGGAKAGAEAGSYDAHGYKIISVDGVRKKAHRLAWLYVHGCWPVSEIDHINRVRNDNRISNLREANKCTNQQNIGPKKCNKSGYLGVYKHNQCNRWAAKITHNGIVAYLGLFNTPEEAHAAYIAAKEKLHTYY